MEERATPRLTFSEETLVYEPGDDMRIFEVVVVVRTENVCRDRGSEVASKLFVVGTIRPHIPSCKYRNSA